MSRSTNASIVAVAGSLIVGIAVAIAEGGAAWLGALLLLGASSGGRPLSAASRVTARTAAPVARRSRDVGAGARGRRRGVIIVGVVGGYLG